jgi:hypothetical protein
MSRFLETIGTILPIELRPEYESLRTELRELAKELPELSGTDVGRPKVIIHRMNEIIDSQPGLRKQARQIEDKLDLFREAMANDESDEE